MYANLFCKTGELAGEKFRIGTEATIGKGAANAIRLNPGTISANHAKIYFDDATHAYILEDLNSRNGTRLDGMRVRGKERLNRLHIITFADRHDFIFQAVDAEMTAESRPRSSAAEAKTVIGEEPMAAPSFGSSEDSGRTMLDDKQLQVPAFEEKKDDDSGRTMFDDRQMATPDLKDKKEPDAGQTMLDNKQGAIPDFKGRDTEEMSKTIIDGNVSETPSIPEEPSSKEEQMTKTVIDNAFAVPPGIQGQPLPESPVHEFVLMFENAKGGKQSFTLKEGTNIIGRSPNCDVTIDDSSMSRNHAVITLSAGNAKIKDMGSKNHTFLNGKRITAEAALSPDDAVTFGLAKTRFAKRG